MRLLSVLSHFERDDVVGDSTIVHFTFGGVGGIGEVRGLALEWGSSLALALLLAGRLELRSEEQKWNEVDSGYNFKWLDV